MTRAWSQTLTSGSSKPPLTLAGRHSLPTQGKYSWAPAGSAVGSGRPATGSPPGRYFQSNRLTYNLKESRSEDGVRHVLGGKPSSTGIPLLAAWQTARTAARVPQVGDPRLHH